jgi:hypothetical protein
MWLILDPNPVRELVVIGITVIFEPPMLYKEFPCDRRWCIAAIPSLRGPANKLMDRVERLSNLISLCSLI